MTNAIKDYLTEHFSEIKQDILTLVKAESPSKQIAELNKARDVLKELMNKHFQDQFTLTEHVSEEYGTHLQFELKDRTDKPRVLFLSHYDTVWQVGELPIEEKDNKLYGPGTFDMKAGLVSSIWAVSALMQEDMPIEPVFLFTADEELGSPSSRPVIEDVAKTCDAVFVMEAPVANTHALKTERKGVGRYEIKAHGLRAHAGNHHEDGINAINEIAKIVVKLEKLTDYSLGTTLNVGFIQGGGAINVVPDYAEIAVDVRVKTMAEAERIQAFFDQLKPEDERVKLEISGGLNRPPLENNEANQRLFAFAKQAGEKLNLDVKAAAVGGGSDGNFTSALGIPTIDGLGIPGDGAHARHEHILLDHVVDKCALTAEICVELAKA